MTILSSLFETVGEQLDGIIDAYRRGVPLPHPETIVEYQDGSKSTFDIKGSLGENSIPNKSNAVKVEIGTDVTSINNRAFYNCSLLKIIVVSSSVTNIGDFVFTYCPEIISISVDPNNTVYDSRNNCNAIIKTSDNKLLYGCKNTVIPNSVATIGIRAFSFCYGLTNITIPNGVTSIEMVAFISCSDLSSITIPSSITNIGIRAFESCNKLTSITCLATSSPTVQSSTFGNSDSDYTGRNTYSSGNNVLKISQGATGYDSGAWLDPLQNASKCGFHIEYI